MRGAPRGQGRKAKPAQQAALLAESRAAVMRELSRPTGAPRPAWMEDAALLPKSPPGRRA